MKILGSVKDDNNRIICLYERRTNKPATVEIKVLRSFKSDWNSFLSEDKADGNFLSERPDIIEEGQ
ncbi:AbrB family transcriptional regulator [Xenorhabdus sp. KJ12.1]|uniref:AbrB family transcriptional regulator n=1 Tax=Xenorhabdus sp. KJ12.1 TaxID=1851571 RepID=UPI000C056915|nr:AbrB family transcriptional regulator [Xenorhabdus sp. KJ12.1]PHM71004.1 AbrB family transcriptional regulator [Xenorhabdus sp. KJ12.1]